MNDVLLEEIESHLSANYLYYEEEKQPDGPGIDDANPLFYASAKAGPSSKKKATSEEWSEEALDGMLSTIEDEDTFGGYVGRLIRDRGLTDAQVYKKANMDRRLFSKIRRNCSYQPSRSTAMSLALALELDLEETQQLLQRAGFTLSKGSKFDVILMYFIERGEYDRILINDVLDHYRCATL